MKLYDLLYPETEPLRLPNINSSSCTFKMAVTSIWIHLSKKAQNERLQRPIPHALSAHIEYEQMFFVLMMIFIFICILFASNNYCSSGLILQLFFYFYFISINAIYFYFCSLSAVLNLCRSCI